MEPNLVCKIVVETSGGKWRRGSGYPITPNRIITAAHVIADAAPAEDGAAEGDARRITLFFGVKAEKLNTPVSIEWCGKDLGVDVAVLRCQLPPALQPAHRLLTQSLHKPIEWFAQGYTDFGKQKRPDGKDGYYGKLIMLPDDQPTVVLDAINGPIKTKEWKGGSGSVAFDSETTQKALSVITEYQDGKKLDQLVAVPICYLLNSKKTKKGFRSAIQFDAYQRRAGYRNDVIHTVASKLRELGKELGPEAFKRVAQEINALPHSGNAGINLQLEQGPLADEAAACIVSHTAATDVIGCLGSLVKDLGYECAEHIADIVDHLLPLNYAPGVIQRLYEQLAADQLGLIESEVATWTLAEIIMAGYDQKPAKFVVCNDGSTDVRGQTALDYYDGPEEGPNQAGAERISVLRAVWNLLRDLFARRDTLWGSTLRKPFSMTASAQSEAELQVEIEDYAIRLRGTLQYVSQSSRGRTVYCVLKLPSEDNPQRDFRKRVLGEVRNHVPQLIFVELMQRAREDREFVVESYYRARFINTQLMRKL